MEDLSLLMYVEIDALCIVLLLYVILKAFGNIERRLNWRYFQFAMVCVVGAILSDLVWKLMDTGVMPSSNFFLYMVKAAYFLLGTLTTTAWFFYAESELGNPWMGTMAYMGPWSLPLLLMVILLAVGGVTGWVFSFDENGCFQRGPLIALGFGIPCLYLFASIIHPVAKVLNPRNYIYRKNYLNLTCFALVTAASVIIQFFLSGTPLPSIGITVAILMTFMTSQELQVSLDPLTKLNNRYHMMRYLSDKMEHAGGNHFLYLMLIDMDKFKQINDTYGHVEGDKALVRMAGVLKLTASTYSCFVARYGGDEFILICETEREGAVDEIVRFINRKLEESNQEAGTEYRLKVSIGYAKYEKEMQYISDFIALADQALYEVKRNR
ncbi:MAG: GGDEF domain-containing protein [Eubacteriales bacterium]|nr:GGDEF domain-containing protein [Eubacteriales bacterium]